MAHLVGSDRSKQKPYLQRNHTFLANGKVKSGARSRRRRSNFLGFIVRGSSVFGHGRIAAYLSVTIRSTNSLIAEEKE